MLYDVIVVGSGISGLYAALYAKKSGLNVAVLTKGNPFRSNSSVASGGFNAVINLAQYDSIQRHVDDTVKGSDGLSHISKIEGMCKEAPHIISELKEMGVKFDEDENGNLQQRPFGGGSANRTCYIADKTGASIVQTLFLACRNEGVHILSNHKFLNITKYKGELSGVTVLRRHNSQVVAFACKSLVLAGGGYAGIFRGYSTNSQESSGDVIAAALRAGMRLSNMEFIQFHPTTLVQSGALVSEAARGEGGHLIDETGKRFTNELMTRDKLSREIVQHILAGHKVYLDVRHLGKEVIETKLPSAQKLALGIDIDLVNEVLEIAPSAHYSIGGIWTREDTSTDLSNVFACGECAATGVHGANRLGGNSLLEGAYFGRMAGLAAARKAKTREFQPIDYAYVQLEVRRVELVLQGDSLYNINSMRKSLGEHLFRNTGVFKDENSLLDSLEYVYYLMERQYGMHCINKDLHNNVELASILEFKNALLIAEAMILSALERKESRGVHYRHDYPNKDDKNFSVDSFMVQITNSYLKVSFGTPIYAGLWYKLKKIFS